MGTIDRAEGQRAYGSDPAAYHDARPSYPAEVFDILQQRCGLRAGSRTFEVGPGTGLATRRLIELGASPLVAIEPDERLAAFLANTVARKARDLDVRITSFERVDLSSDWFDLGTSASAFHWLDEMASLRKVARVLRQGGWWAVWWNLLFDGSRTDEFQKATQFLFDQLDRSPSSGSDEAPPFALDTRKRIACLRAVDAFENIEANMISWAVLFDTERVMRLYATFSPISRLEPAQRQRLLDSLGLIADKQFGGKVELQIKTPMYTAQRRAIASNLRT